MSFTSDRDTDTILFCTCVSQIPPDLRYIAWYLLSILGCYIADCSSDRRREGGCGVWEWLEPGTGEHNRINLSMTHLILIGRPHHAGWNQFPASYVPRLEHETPADMSISVTITIYAMCATEFYVRYAADWPLRKAPTSVEPMNTMPGGEVLTKRTTLMTAGLVFSTTLLFIRQVLRKYFYVPR